MLLGGLSVNLNNLKTTPIYFGKFYIYIISGKIVLEIEQKCLYFSSKRMYGLNE